MYKFNINDFIKVKLTEYGKKIYEHRYDEMIRKYPHLRSILSNPELKVDKDGYSEFQLHEFMDCFGSYMYNGAPQIIENNEIYFEKGLEAVAPTIPKLDIKIGATPVKDPKPFGAVGKMVKEVEEEKKPKNMLPVDVYRHICRDDEVYNCLSSRFSFGIQDIIHLCSSGRLTMDIFKLDNHKSFEVYYLDDKPIIEVTIEKRYNELHGYGYLSLTEEEVRSIKVLK